MTASEHRYDNPDEIQRTEQEPKNTLTISNITGALYLTARQCSLSSKKKAGVFLVEFEYGGRKERTPWSKSTTKPSWTDDLTFPCSNAHSGDVLKIKVFYEQKKDKEKLRCEAEDVLENLDVSKPLDKLIKVSKWVNGTAPDLHLDFRLTTSSLVSDAVDAVPADDAVLPTVLEVSPAIEHTFDRIDHIVNGASAIQPIGESLEAVIEAVDSTVTIIEEISKIHPYAKLAFSVVTAAYKVLKAQRDRDNEMNSLITIMRETYQTILDARGKWDDSDNLDPVWDKVSVVTVDCCNFICKYRETKRFASRAFKNAASRTDETIKEYKVKFQEIQEAFQRATAEDIHGAIMSINLMQFKLLEEVKDLHTDINLNDMIYPTGANFDPQKVCLRGTRDHALHVLRRFAGGFSVEEEPKDRDPSVLWIRGAAGTAGTGKSFLAHRLVELLTPSNKIGSCFFFNYRNLKDAPPHSLFPRITQDLASAHSAWRHALNAIIGGDRGIRQETSIFQQFELLLLKPALAVRISQPLLFVIDGLDEAGDRKGRSEMIRVLTSRLHELPPNFRFVLFSRPEQDIVDAFSKHQHHTVLDMQKLCSKDDEDTRKVIEDKFKDLRQLPENQSWITDDALSHLVLKSGGLMIYARTACDFIIDAHEDGFARQERLALLLKSDKVPEMDELYRTILNTIIPHNPTARQRFRVTIGRVLCLEKPLPFAAYVGLDRGTTDLHASRVILPKMGSLLGVTNDIFRSIFLIHKSFADFVGDRERSGADYHVNTSDHNKSLLEACLSVMEMGLKFNVCDNISSDLNPDDNPRWISVELDYACKFWGVHLHRTSYDSAIAARLKKMYETNLLYWFEALVHTRSPSARLDRPGYAQECMEHMIGWSQRDNKELADKGLATQTCLRDRDDFHVESCSHIYLSALPFVASTNWVHHQYRHLFHHLPVVRSELWAADPLVARVLFQVRDRQAKRQTVDPKLIRVRYSPSGIFILVSSGTHFVLLDSTTYGPVWSKESEFRAWEFSPDGNRIHVLGRCLELEVIQTTDGTCCSSLMRIQPTEYAIGAMISPDCRSVICLTNQGTLQKWCTRTGNRIISSTLLGFHSFDGEVKFSPDGGSLLRWGGERPCYQIARWCVGIPSPRIFKGHTAPIREAICSPDNARLFSYDDDCTIRAWNLHSGEEIWHTEVHVQHKDGILCLAISRDNRLVASGSGDQTVRLWDAIDGRLMCKPLESQHGWPMALAFSPDGGRLICITYENVICVWNVELALSALHHYACPLKYVRSVHISSDSLFLAVAVKSDIIRIQETKSARVLARKSVRSYCDLYGVLAFSPEVLVLAYADDAHRIGLWHWQTSEQDHHLYEGHTDHIWSLCFSPNAELLLSASQDRTIRVWDIRSGTALPLRVIHTNGEWSIDCAFAAVFAESGNLIASAHYSGISIKVWNPDVEEPLKQRYQWPLGPDVMLASSPAGGRLLSASERGIQLWNIVDGLLSKFGNNLEAGHENVCSAAFSPNGYKVAVGFGDKTIQIWDADTGRKFGAPLHSHRKAHSLAFSLDGRHILAASMADGLVDTWDISTEPSASAWKNKVADRRRYADDPWDGWVYDTGPDESRLFWVPERFRPGFVWSDRHRVIGYPETRVDISDFVHGKDWTKCWKGPTSAVSDPGS
ncbi:hypothetical protein SISSUDRAFT_1045687 [Sistotremastrum suecicum HHB10207 ss-3]|uniref:C2 domain-containing protein n=1 Tax=Sistotremastrum suecicum HHB10207 ss-3 TaxID=1314776 RepID=A0A166EAJ9_9AGAM|nr:hypothetical protein SISSUDRAFT_1045687 [Sistotremastrum suecicum HHB10207 ss-3]